MFKWISQKHITETYLFLVDSLGLHDTIWAAGPHWWMWEEESCDRKQIKVVTVCLYYILVIRNCNNPIKSDHIKSLLLFNQIAFANTQKKKKFDSDFWASQSWKFWKPDQTLHFLQDI